MNTRRAPVEEMKEEKVKQSQAPDNESALQIICYGPADMPLRKLLSMLECGVHAGRRAAHLPMRDRSAPRLRPQSDEVTDGGSQDTSCATTA